MTDEVGPRAEKRKKVGRSDLILSERFHRAKRNLIWLSGAIIVISLAAHKEIKIPGLGDDSVLPLRIGLLLLAVGLIVAVIEYVPQAVMAFVQHSDAVFEADSAEIRGLFKKQEETLQAVIGAVGTVKVHANYAEHVLDENGPLVPSLQAKAMENAKEHAATSGKQRDDIRVV